jgi:hypothetical protein
VLSSYAARLARWWYSTKKPDGSSLFAVARRRQQQQHRHQNHLSLGKWKEREKTENVKNDKKSYSNWPRTRSGRFLDLCLVTLCARVFIFSVFSTSTRSVDWFWTMRWHPAFPPLDTGRALFFTLDPTKGNSCHNSLLIFKSIIFHFQRLFSCAFLLDTFVLKEKRSLNIIILDKKKIKLKMPVLHNNNFSFSIEILFFSSLLLKIS